MKPSAPASEFHSIICLGCEEGELSLDCRIWKQRREQMLREVERNRRAKALRAVRKRRHGRRSALVWEMKRRAGRLLKFPRRTWRNAGY